MNTPDIVRIDGIKWLPTKSTTGSRMVVGLCPKHDLRLTPVPDKIYKRGSYVKGHSWDARKMQCAEGPHFFDILRKYDEEQKYVLDRIDALSFGKMSVLNLDDEAIPVAEEELKDKDSPYWVKSKVTESKSGVRLIIWAGDRAKKNKTQLFVEPGLKRLGFDHNDDHPTEVFAKVDVTFADDNHSSISRDVE